MSTLPKRSPVNHGERFTAVYLQPAKAQLSESEHGAPQMDALGPAFECVEKTGHFHKLSDKEMCALLKIAQSKYRTHGYNIATVGHLPLEMQQTFARFYAETVGLRVPQEPTVQALIREAARDAIVRLLDVMAEAT